jgi:hypothetical protein
MTLMNTPKVALLWRGDEAARLFGSMRDDLASKVTVDYRDLGKVQLKGMPASTHVYEVTPSKD